MTMGADTPKTLFYNQFDFDKDGNLTRLKKFDTDVSTIRLRTSNVLHTTTIDYKYVLNGNGIKTAAYAVIKSDSSFTSKYEFDARGNLIKSIPNIGDSSEYITAYKYDKTGNVIEATSPLSKSHSKASVRYRYSTNGDMIELAYYEGKSILVKITFDYREFDQHKNWTKAISTRNNLDFHQTFKDTISRKLTYY